MPEWKSTTIGDVLTLQRGFDITKAEQRQGIVPVVSSGGINSYHDTAAARGPGVVIGRKGTLGTTFYMPNDYWPHDTTLWVKDFKGSLPRFVYYFFTVLDVKGLDVGSANPTLNRNHVHPIPVRWPERAVQKRIAAVLGALDDKIAVNDRIQATYEAILGTRFYELRIDIEPSAENAISASEIIDFNPTLPAPAATGAVYLDMSAVPTNSARVRGWSWREPKSGTRFANGCTVMARITPCLENGKAAFVDFMADGEVGVGSTEFIVMRSRTGFPMHLSYFLARSSRFRNNAIRNMLGSSGRQRVNAAQLVDFPLSRAHDDQLNSFDQAACVAFDHMKSLGAEARTLAELRDVLLPKLMSGEIRVRDAEKEVEDAS
jgi:type I restriction enzyme S subunit